MHCEIEEDPLSGPASGICFIWPRFPVLAFLSLLFLVSLRESKMLHSQIFVFKFSPKYEGNGISLGPSRSFSMPPVGTQAWW